MHQSRANARPATVAAVRASTLAKELAALQTCSRCAGGRRLLKAGTLHEDDTDIWGIVHRGEHGAAIHQMTKFFRAR